MRSVPLLCGMRSNEFTLSRHDLLSTAGLACVVVNVRLRLRQALPKAQISRLRRSLVTTFEVSFGLSRWTAGDVVLGGPRAQSKPVGIDDDRLRALGVGADPDRRQRRMRVREWARRRSRQRPTGCQKQQE